MNRWYARRRWIYGGLAALLALDAALYFGWLHRPVERAENDPAQLALLEQEVAERAAEVARLKRVREQAPQLNAQLNQFTDKHFLTERKGFAEVAAELEEAAKAAGARLSQVDYDNRAERDRPGLLRVEMRTGVEGSYLSLLRYLDALEHSPHFYLINELSVAGARGRRLQVQIHLATYFRQGKA